MKSSVPAQAYCQENSEANCKMCYMKLQGKIICYANAKPHEYLIKSPTHLSTPSTAAILPNPELHTTDIPQRQTCHHAPPAHPSHQTDFSTTSTSLNRPRRGLPAPSSQPNTPAPSIILITPSPTPLPTA
ncbi:MAG: hypothetical protein FRX48_06256 [Lasallia pustulata]|uniref:Uncharacterized protein n=1 Tax=Lasallia pustulata TaxID=136370 RepID=A0A5M8PMC4_9LECA|nr:MAG: hypothetical protein FRX48_06256 [Lasallia pustulata]